MTNLGAGGGEAKRGLSRSNQSQGNYISLQKDRKTLSECPPIPPNGSKDSGMWEDYWKTGAH